MFLGVSLPTIYSGKRSSLVGLLVFAGCVYSSLTVLARAIRSIEMGGGVEREKRWIGLRETLPDGGANTKTRGRCGCCS